MAIGNTHKKIEKDRTVVLEICSWTDKHTHTRTRLMALCPGLPGWAGTGKIKPIWILLKQETVSYSGISWDVCKSAPHSRQTTMPAPHRSVFTGRMPFLPCSQQCQSTEGKSKKANTHTDRQTDTVITIICFPYRGGGDVIMFVGRLLSEHVRSG